VPGESMTEDLSCPECGGIIKPADAVARHPDGICHARCIRVPEALPESKDDEATPPTS
jgi:hypothetical protein